MRHQDHQKEMKARSIALPLHPENHDSRITSLQRPLARAAFLRGK